MKKFFAYLLIIVFGNTSLSSQNVLDSLLGVAEKYSNHNQYVSFLKEKAKDTTYASYALELLIEAKTYVSGYQLPTDAELYDLLARKYTQNFMHAYAIPLYDTLYTYYIHRKDTVGMIHSLIDLASCYNIINKPEKALTYFEKGEQILAESRNRVLKFTLYYNISHFFTIKKINIAEKYIQRCFDIAKALDNDSLFLESLIEMGRICVNNQQIDSAFYFYEQARKLIDRMDYSQRIDQYYNSLANYYQVSNNDEKSLEYYLKSYAITLKNKNYIGLYVTSYNLYNLYTKMKDKLNAEKYLMLSLDYAVITGIEQYKSTSYYHLQSLYADKKDYKKAYEYAVLYNESLDNMYFKEFYAQIADLTLQYELLKKQDEIKSLTQENDIKTLQAKNNRLITIGLIIFIIILIIVSFIIYKHIQVKTKQKINELTLQNLIQQMNPHFIFNTLNSIQYYMYNHSELETNEYISKFSQLIRKILENTNNSKVKIMDELEAIKLYIELEQLRFNNSFDYQITLPSDASLDEYKIPTMFIQPFVENAIIHGLRHLKDKGLLSITISVKNGLLICEIDDNGIGRFKAEEINADNKHKSLSLSIANERLKLLSSSTYTKLKINYYDKSTTPGERGTKVIIELPIFK